MSKNTSQTERETGRGSSVVAVNKAMGFMGILTRIFKVQIKYGTEEKISKEQSRKEKKKRLRFCARIM